MSQRIYTPPSPAPWAIGVRTDSGKDKPQICIIADDGSVIARLGAHLPTDTDADRFEVAMANARSMAAVPFLIEGIFALRDAYIRMLLDQQRDMTGRTPDGMSRAEQETYPVLAVCNAALDMAVFGTGLPKAPSEVPNPEIKH